MLVLTPKSTIGNPMICKNISTLLSETQIFPHWAPVAQFGSSPIISVVHTILKNIQSVVCSFSFLPFWIYTCCSHGIRYYHYTFCSSRKCPEFGHVLYVKPPPPVGKATTLFPLSPFYFTQTTVDACDLLYGDVSAYCYVFVGGVFFLAPLVRDTAHYTSFNLST